MLNPFIMTFFLMAFAYASYADVATDGSMGAAQTLVGPNFVIEQQLGTLKGDNLFHSFREFSLSAEQSARFTGDATIKNVISRVTGGQVSDINGHLMSDIGSQGFYLINPAGVVFGANAQVDVPGSFYVSSADELRFSDGGVFSSDPDKPSQLSIDAPQSFGFLKKHHADIVISGSHIELPPQQTFSISAGNIVAQTDSASGQTANIKVNSGVIKLHAQGEQSGVVDVGRFQQQGSGNISLNGAGLDVSGIESSNNGAGGILLSAANITTGDNTQLKMNNETAQNNASAVSGLHVLADTLQMDQSVITAQTKSSGNGVSMDIKADKQLSLRNTQIYSENTSGSTGKNGTIHIRAKEMKMTENSRIYTTTYSDQNGGDINIEADSLLLDGYTQNNTTTYGASIRADTSAYIKDNDEAITQARGNAGNIHIQADKVSLLRSAQISSSTYSAGQAGTIQIDSNELLIDGQAYYGKVFDPDSGAQLLLATGISAKSLNYQKSIFVDDTDRPVYLPDGSILINPITGKPVYHKKKALISEPATGHGGEIVINSTTSSIKNGGQISVNTEAFGNAGTIVMNTDSLLIQNEAQYTQKRQTGIFSSSAKDARGNSGDIGLSANTIELNGADTRIANNVFSAEGQGGQVDIMATTLRMFDNSGISGYTNGAGNASDLNMRLDSLSMSGQSAIYNLTNGSGNAGKITLTARQIDINNSLIDSDATASGHAGTISVHAQTIAMADRAGISSKSIGAGDAADIYIDAADGMDMQNLSYVITDAQQSNAGKLFLSGGRLLLRDSLLTTSVGRFLGQDATTFGNGGNIQINNSKLYMRGGFIQANTQGVRGKGGDIRIDADPVIASYKLEIGGGEPLTFRRDSGLNIIQAAAPEGAPGNIDIRSPIRDLSAELARLDTDFKGLAEISRSPCASGKKNTLIIMGDKARSFRKPLLPLLNSQADKALSQRWQYQKNENMLTIKPKIFHPHVFAQLSKNCNQ